MCRRREHSWNFWLNGMNHQSSTMNHERCDVRREFWLVGLVNKCTERLKKFTPLTLLRFWLYKLHDCCVNKVTLQCVCIEMEAPSTVQLFWNMSFIRSMKYSTRGSPSQVWNYQSLFLRRNSYWKCRYVWAAHHGDDDVVRKTWNFEPKTATTKFQPGKVVCTRAQSLEGSHK